MAQNTTPVDRKPPRQKKIKKDGITYFFVRWAGGRPLFQCPKTKKEVLAHCQDIAI